MKTHRKLFNVAVLSFDKSYREVLRFENMLNKKRSEIISLPIGCFIRYEKYATL